MPELVHVGYGRSITLETALDENADIISQVTHFAAAEKLSRELWDNRRTIAALVRHHLGLGDGDSCHVEPRDGWIRGGFNICVLVKVQSRDARRSRRLIFRCPMAHKLAETSYPGTVDEKLGCEIGMYAWMQDWCTDIRIPYLYGFGFSDHRHVRRSCRLGFRADPCA